MRFELTEPDKAIFYFSISTVNYLLKLFEGAKLRNTSAFPNIDIKLYFFMTIPGCFCCMYPKKYDLCRANLQDEIDLKTDRNLLFPHEYAVLGHGSDNRQQCGSDDVIAQMGKIRRGN
jgi:hypothetical protein